MGGICTKSNTSLVSSPDQFIPAEIVLQRNQLELQIDESYILSINNKFNEFFSLIKNEFSGSGIKRTIGFKSFISKDNLLKKREEFWDTRTEGHPEAWQTIKAAVESDEETALAFLNASGLKLLKNSIQFLYDEGGMRYDVPVFCINEPLLYEIKQINEKKIINFNKEVVNIKIRCAKINQDLKLSIENTIKIDDLKELFIKNEKIVFQKQNLRIFVRGKEMKDNHLLGEYEITNDDVLQIFVMNRE